jgi:hypothetical protein
MKQQVYQISLTIRNKKDVLETEKLEVIRNKTKFSQADIYLMGLRQMDLMLKKAKAPV